MGAKPGLLVWLGPCDGGGGMGYMFGFASRCLCHLRSCGWYPAMDGRSGPFDAARLRRQQLHMQEKREKSIKAPIPTDTPITMFLFYICWLYFW